MWLTILCKGGTMFVLNSKRRSSYEIRAIVFLGSYVLCFWV